MNPFFSMENNHGESSGIPPSIANEESKNYYGYFENRYGEQWVFIYDHSTKKASLRGGNLGWGKIANVNNGTAENVELDPVEQMWLQACWNSF